MSKIDHSSAGALQNENFWRYYAHSRPSEPSENWHLLEDHLQAVAEMAAGFARFFGAENWADIAGRWHDLGKGTLSWQAYLRHENNVTDEFSAFYSGHPVHAIVGAQELYKQSDQAGKLLAYCIAGHHGGLPNWHDDAIAALKSRLMEDFTDVDFPHSAPKLPSLLPLSKIEQNRLGFIIQFFVRMLFSCLVDADYLDTEASLSNKKSVWRSGYPALDELSERFSTNFDALRNKADSTTVVNQYREKVLNDCLKSAEFDPGLFSLTVPTGGGKTLASLAFALAHAKKYGKRRIIYVIPFTSIIEQNAQVFRDMLGDDAILEHHCNFMVDESDWKSLLASENWDAPIIVTTNVQFFNSFYASKTSYCRKLHNVADSIVIFDEVQAIPVEKLSPCMEVIKELSLNYGVSSILCTATQPAIEYSEQFQSGLQGVREIIQDVHSLFGALKRTEESFIGELSVQDVATKLSNYEQVLCIVNTRQQALDIYNALPKSDGTIHLSALMYPLHRTNKLNEIRRRLHDGEPCRVVSTQLIEAGVDVDFPCVFRVVAGIDSIAQAAGRCNRNGLHEKACQVFVFSFADLPITPFIKQAAQSAEKLFDLFKGKLTSPECVREYFYDYFWKNQQRMDSEGIVSLCQTAQSGEIQFKKLADFEIINSATIPVIIALDQNSLTMVEELKYSKYKGRILRKLQKYTVQIHSNQIKEIQKSLEVIVPGIFVLISDVLYSSNTGLKCSTPQGNAFIH
ncbi:CRISPR-associated helicase/endonuclease Cas3 [Pelodictyon phaeoclathratiforme]|jgi:CRISPR-associated endonuclease/helicase Cas3|uniref:CRISPR-associated helicase Cas3 n=1 Tax=Pelodictyon phaeoclathratiforme (strain DSM 5477 / BU-1) TaxID=324925 RepID=B4SAU8_PELPB|nr:CRISPR-associated helicase/endonuclease Cas3 [Pelodictyon phaeoclathratiforme]ACF43894.1 CRISPR-associated helicase Cas3 [Pelodictyon phaeoclathratiforme BU-1]